MNTRQLLEPAACVIVLIGGYLYLAPRSAGNSVPVITDSAPTPAAAAAAPAQVVAMSREEVRAKYYGAAARSPLVESSSDCAGVIDALSGTRLPSGRLQMASPLYVRGWLAVSVERAEVPEESYFALLRADGFAYLLRLPKSARPDVAAHFGKPPLANSGFEGVLDAARVPRGDYILGFARKFGGRLELCAQPRVPVALTDKSS
jgi:hypothetical protein